MNNIIKQCDTPDFCKPIPKVQKISAILWPSFFMSGIANSLFFILISPEDLLVNSNLTIINDMEVYSIGFILFWLFSSMTCLLTYYFLKPCSNRPDF